MVPRVGPWAAFHYQRLQKWRALDHQRHSAKDSHRDPSDFAGLVFSVDLRIAGRQIEVLDRETGPLS